MQKGFTLYELLITVLVVGVMLTLGVPNLTEFIANSRITATTNDLHSTFILARTEAARAKQRVTICASSGESGCNSSSFNDGWIVFVDEDEDGDADASVEPILRSFPAAHSSIDITTRNSEGGPAASFTFAPTGMGSGQADSLSVAIVCDDRGNEITAGGWSAARALIVTPLGRSTILRDPSYIEIQGGCP